MMQIRSVRENANLRQSDIAKILGISRSTYSSYETERDTIPIKHLNKLCNYFNISIDYAVGLTNIMQYENNRPEIDKIVMPKRLKKLRKSEQLTQEGIAKILNTSRSTWTGYEYGHYQISTLLLVELCKRYHYSVDYILGKTDINHLQ